MAAAYVLCNFLGYDQVMIDFTSKSGMLTVLQKDDWLVMDFPAQLPIHVDMPDEIIKAFAKKLIDCLHAEDYIVVFEIESDISLIKPDME